MFKKRRLFLENKLTALKITIFTNMSTENFEYKTAMERLENILERIDNSEMEIDELAGAVQEATDLLRKCRQILVATEKSVQEALSGLDGETETGA
jgi:exodeoxyribonuclease VII small subunit